MLFCTFLSIQHSDGVFVLGDKDHVDLHWAPPLSDGGAPIEKYIIEKRSRYGRWEPAIEVPGTETKATVPNLTEKEEYEFRVIAVNKGGPSEPSDPSNPVVCKPRNRKLELFGLVLPLFGFLCF